VQELAGVDVVKAVDVLGRADGVYDRVGVDLVRRVERQLDYDSVHGRVRVELSDAFENFDFLYGALEFVVVGDDADLARRLELVFDVDVGVVSVANLVLNFEL
jgi:hypothetical protein